MTDKEKLEAIKAEIERLMYAYNQEADIASAEDSIAEKAAELIVQKEYPESPVIPPFNPVVPYPWTTPPTPREPITVMYGVVPTQFEVQGDATTSASISTKKEEG